MMAAEFQSAVFFWYNQICGYLGQNGGFMIDWKEVELSDKPSIDTIIRLKPAFIIRSANKGVIANAFVDTMVYIPAF